MNALHAPRVSLKRQRGLSLIELMISITIGLILLIGVTSLIVQQSATRDELEKSSRQIENGRYAVQILHTDLEQAGFYGLFYAFPAYSLGTTLPDPCDATLAGLQLALPLYVQGYDNALPGSNFSCPLDGVATANNGLNYQAGTDILVIRHTDTSANPITFNGAASGATDTTTTSLTQGQVYLQTIGGSEVMGVGAGAPDNSINYPLYLSTRSTTAPPIYSPLRQYLVHVYFISPCSIPAGGGTSCTGAADDNGHPIPTLRMLELKVVGGRPAFTLTPLVEGIENMQFEYGVDGDNTVAAASAVDGYPDAYCTNPDVTGTCSAPNNFPPLGGTNPTNWQNIMAIRINVLSRNTQCTTGYTDAKTYQLGSLATPVAAGSLPPVPYYAAASAVACPNGDYKRHVFNELVRLINPSARRAAQ